ncbi:MAG TPA: hypothetical protein VFV38_44190 [Ktedonobacteraceae bacterium]|nr:hypothetical protein [Ktedonobacteraceae bacterium]
MINLRFRPSLIVFVNEEGKQICKQLKQIIQLTQFDEVLHQCIALLQVTALEEPEQSQQTSVRFEQARLVPVGQEFPPDEDIPASPADLDLLLQRAIDNIQLNKRLIEIRTAGYPVPETRPQIYIVGNARSVALREIHKIIRKELQRRFFTTEVCYILDAFDSPDLGNVQAQDDLAPAQPDDPYWGREDVPNFCFFYEKYLSYPQPSTVTREESHYAAAESLFALISTGITPEPQFENYLQPPTRLTTYTNVGSMNTTLLIFPREAALTFASARLGSALVEQWLDDLNRELLPEDRRRSLQIQARNDVKEIEDWLRDKELRPAANEVKQEITGKQEAIENTRKLNWWPTLHILKERPGRAPIPERVLNQQRDLLRELEEQTITLFRLFHFHEVEIEAHRYRKRPDTWIRLMDQRGRRAIEAYYEWNQLASRTWEAAGTRIGEEVKCEVDTLWSSRANSIHGFEIAKTYVDAFDEHLVKLQDRLIRLRAAHQQNYTESLDHFERLSDGEWLAQPNALNQQGGAGATTQASPHMDDQASASQPVTGGETGTGDGRTSHAATHQHLPAREMQIVDQLERRILWWQEQVPSIPTQITISLPLLVALVLSSSALYPQGGPLVTLIVTLVALLTTGLLNTLFWWRYQKKVREAKKDLLRFYCRHFAHRSETREDALRLLVSVPLRQKTMRMRERLDTISAFIGGVRTRLDESAQQVQRTLFTTPSGARDIYIVNGERLQRHQKNTLEDLALQVTNQRENRPAESWHRTLREIKERLIDSFRNDQQSIIEMTEEDARQRIDTFARGITQKYLHGSLDNIQRALENNDIWREARDRACSPLYQALVGMRQPQLFFVCGQNSLLTPLRVQQGRGAVRAKTNWPVDAIPVRISDHHDWVLFAAFFSGGTPPALDSNILFPAKHLVSSVDDLYRGEAGLNGTGNIPDGDDEQISHFPGDLGDEDDDATPGRGIPIVRNKASTVLDDIPHIYSENANDSLAQDISSWIPGNQDEQSFSSIVTTTEERSWSDEPTELSRPNGLPEVADPHLNAFLQHIPLHSIGIKGAENQMEQYLARRKPTADQIRAWVRELGIISQQVFQDPTQARQKRAVQAMYGVLRDIAEATELEEIDLPPYPVPNTGNEMREEA